MSSNIFQSIIEEKIGEQEDQDMLQNEILKSFFIQISWLVTTNKFYTNISILAQIQN